jgi:hypothetical protein
MKRGDTIYCLATVTSFFEYGEYQYVSAADIKKAPALKQAFSSCSTTCSEGH